MNIVFTYVFTGVKNFLNKYSYQGPKLEYFGCEWNIEIMKLDDHFGIFLRVSAKQSDGWSVKVDPQYRIIAVNGKNKCTALNSAVYNNTNVSLGQNRFLEWDTLEKDYLVNDQIIAEIEVKILEMNGIERVQLKNFNELGDDESDVALIVQQEKFYVCKRFLSSQSDYFKGLFNGKFKEAKENEVVLQEIRLDEMQDLLDFLYHESEIAEGSVEGILRLADMWRMKNVLCACEKFLMKESKNSMKFKVNMATSYRFENLKKQCLDNLKSRAEIRAVIGEDASKTDPKLAAILLEKMLSL